MEAEGITLGIAQKTRHRPECIVLVQIQANCGASEVVLYLIWPGRHLAKGGRLIFCSIGPIRT